MLQKLDMVIKIILTKLEKYSIINMEVENGKLQTSTIKQGKHMLSPLIGVNYQYFEMRVLI